MANFFILDPRGRVLILDPSGRFSILDPSGRSLLLDPSGQFRILDTSNRFSIQVPICIYWWASLDTILDLLRLDMQCLMSGNNVLFWRSVSDFVLF